MFDYLITQFLGCVYARKDPQDYWKGVMNGKPMPEEIRDLYNQYSISQSHLPKHFEIAPQILKTHSQYHSPKDFEIAPQILKTQNHIQKTFDITPQILDPDPKSISKRILTLHHKF